MRGNHLLAADRNIAAKYGLSVCEPGIILAANRHAVSRRTGQQGAAVKRRIDMREVTQPDRARGTMLSAVAMVAALAALLALAPFASAASDPLASGTTTITLNKNLLKKLKKAGG